MKLDMSQPYFGVRCTPNIKPEITVYSRVDSPVSVSKVSNSVLLEAYISYLEFRASVSFLSLPLRL